mmetsp:Transcript_142793/g.259628  ORF Transcript_142793/g.259628 Transcript_142793/m.259628 type:complete len:2277 (-) Transcript_142793:264-7094(-)
MGGGASKKKQGNEVQVASTAKAAGAAQPVAEPKSGVPEKPKDAPEMKRPRPGKGKKDKQLAQDSRSASDLSAAGSSGAEEQPAAAPRAPAPSPAPTDKAEEEEHGLPAESEKPPRMPNSAVQPRTLEEDHDEEAQRLEAAEQASLAASRPPIAPSSPAAQREISPEELITACREGDATTVQAFLVANARTSKGLGDCEEALFDAYGDSVLHHAVHGGSEQVVASLIELGRVQVDIPNARNETALQLACRRGEAKLVSILLAAEADPDRRDSNGLTPFLSAVFTSQDEETLSLLMRAQANVSAQDDRGISALHFAALRGDKSLLTWLVRNGANANLQSEHGTTPLMLAARRGHEESVTLLLAHQANTHLTDEAGCTALMHALSCSGTSEAAKKILAETLSIDQVDGAGRSAIFHAVLGGRVDGLQAVIQREGRVNILDEEGRSPLYQACLMGDQAVVQCLLDAGADPNLAGRGSSVRPMVQQEEDADGEREADAARACLEEARTCLQVCAALAHDQLLQRILDNNADINAAPGALGWTALHLCAAVGNEQGAALLLSRGAATSLMDAEGNLAATLAERAGHEAVLARIKDASKVEPGATGETAEQPERRHSLRASLPPLHAHPEPDPPAEEQEPLATFKQEWEERRSDGSLLDRVFGPMVHDALLSDQWRIRWEAITLISKTFSEIASSPTDLVKAVAQVLYIGVHDKIPKVFLASLGIFEELLSDARADVLSPEEFTSLMRGKKLPGDSDESQADQPGRDVLVMLLDQTDAAGGSSAASSPHQAAADTLCSCILHGHLQLDEAAYPLLVRIDKRLRGDAEQEQKDRKEAALVPKCLACNFKLLGRWLTTFGLQQSGLFRRTLILPMLLRGAASEHSKVRAAANEALVQLMSLSGGIEERIWSLLPSKARKGVQRVVSGQEGITLVNAVPCEEDALPKSVIVAEDNRAASFVCVSELTPPVWAQLQTGGGKSSGKSGSKHSKANARAAVAAAAAATPRDYTGDQDAAYGAADDAAADALQQAFKSKNWKERAESIAALAGELSSYGDGVKLVEDSGARGEGATASGGPLLSQYVLRGHRLSTLQESLSALLVDKVTAVYVATADLLRLCCGHMPLYIAPLFLEPLLPAIVARLMDTSKKVSAKTLETILQVASFHSCALSEMIVQCIASGSAWNSGTPTNGGQGERTAKENCERSTGPRLQLLVQLMNQCQAQGSLGNWTDDTWKALADYAMVAAEHRSGDVRKDAAALLTGMKDSCIEGAGLAADRAVAQLQQMAQQKLGRRPGTGSTRLGTGSTLMNSLTRPITGSRLNSSLGASGRLNSSLGASGRLSTGNRSQASRTGSNFRPVSGALGKSREIDEESDNSVHSDAPAAEMCSPNGGDGDGIAFMDVKTACPGADEIIDLAEGEAALQEALPLAEALDEMALDFVAPLIALFGEQWTQCFYSRWWQCRVAALMHLSASMPRRLEEISTPEMAAPALGELLDGAMRAVHEGLGDQNVRVYAEACRAVSAVVPAFCGVVDGRLLVAHLAPLLRQLCARMGDSKEVVRTQTTQSLFRLLRPPTGNIVSPVALAMLILRHLVPQREARDGAEAGSESPKGNSSNSKASRSAATGWLCRLAALRDLAKEYHKSIVMQPGTPNPGEWLRLKDGLAHADPTVRHESARLYALVCKMHLRSTGDELAQQPARESWVAALPKDLPPKSIVQVRRLLKLPERAPDSPTANPSSPKSLKLQREGSQTAWEVPASLASWVGCPVEVLAALRLPTPGDEKAVMTSLKILGKAVSGKEVIKKDAAPPEDIFANICKAIQQVLSSPLGADRRIFLCTLDLCQTAVTNLAPRVSGLDVNMGLVKTFPVLLDRTSQSADVKVAVASDKLVQLLAKHPKVGCEAVTKMVISAVARAERPMRPLVLLRTLLSDFGLRLCAQRDVVMLLLGAVAAQLERADTSSSSNDGAEEDVDGLKTQLIGVLSTCNQFSPETVHRCMAEEEPAHRKLLMAALQAAPNPRLVALGASAAEQESMERGGHVAGSAIRAASRGREPSPKPEEIQASHGVSEASPDRRRRPPPGPLPSMESTSGDRLRRTESMRRSRGSLHGADGSQRRPSGSPPMAPNGSPDPRGHSQKSSVLDNSPGNRRRRRDREGEGSPSIRHMGHSTSRNDLGDSMLSEASTTASAEQSPAQPRFPPGGASSSENPRWFTDGPSSRPPAPMEMSTALQNGREMWRFKEGDGDYEEQWKSINNARSGSSEGRLMKGKEGSNADSLAALMDVLSAARNKTR